MSSDHIGTTARHVAAAVLYHSKRALLTAGAEHWVYDIATDSFGLGENGMPRIRVPCALVTTDPELSAAYAKASRA